ncbi:MAG TPA: endonuclease/exonuclease/phosphatase family protein [Croceibacterium sp.]|nr:endonuclease/exonuclease/phosphatase family protein [Croceibacterium sp.]
MRLTFASYNIHKGVGTDGVRDPERIAAVLRELDADVIALQEADRRFGERPSVIPKALLEEMPWRAVHFGGSGPSLGWHGNALLVRKGIELRAAEPLRLPTIEPRGAVCGELIIEEHSVRVLGMHLDLSGLRRRDQIKAVLRHHGAGAECPAVLMGDFNQWGSNSGAMREFGPAWQVLETGRSFPSRQPVARLDRIVASHHWRIEDAGVHRSALSTRASDHLPVWARLNLA